MKLKSLTSVITKSALVLAACASLNAFAGTPAPSGKGPVPPVQEDPALFDSVGAELAVGYDTRYYYRGLYFADNTTWAGLNLSIPLTEQLSFGFGALYTSSVDSPVNFAAPGGSDSLEYSELDLSGSLTYDAGFAKFSAVYTHYFFFDSFGGSVNGFAAAGNDPEFGIKGANEVGFTASTTVGGLNLSAGYYYDLTIGGQYIEVGADYPIAITPWLSLVPAVKSGYGFDYYTGSNSPLFAGALTKSSGFTHVLFSLSAPIKLTKSATLTPYVAWNLGLETRNYLNATHDNEIFGGVKLGVAF